ncbi:MAG: heparinase II/III family protein [Anaerolineales bacterium]|nr:heparinase II/III family protein [Anaerolineales bacterium]
MNWLLPFRAARELGLRAVVLNALYRLGVQTGYFRLQEATNPDGSLPTFRFLFDLPARESLLTLLGDDGMNELTAAAEEVVAGRYRQFGGEPVDINLKPPSLRHWTECERTAHRTGPMDIKFIWEPARFGWVFPLGRAYHLTREERYAEAFWRFFEAFQAANPPFLGENWMSGQEAALRLLAFVWAGQVFAPAQASAPERMAALTQAIAKHALRLPPTLLYARSQNNNHLLTEAVALYTAGLALPTHPHAPRWQKAGLRWLNWCLENQIDETGEYVQHSTNYHRLMLQTALWVFACERVAGEAVFTHRSRENLARAAGWLAVLLDPFSGRVPNLGPNDGAYLFPLASLAFADFRPVVYAALRAFAHEATPPGVWDEMALWFGVSHRTIQNPGKSPPLSHPHPLPKVVAPGSNSWAYLRTATFRSRPGHADLLHLDLWCQGQNITLDPGTYLYNASPPWNNALTHARFHNTVTVEDADQFTRAGRFLYLDWRHIQCAWRDETRTALTAYHTAYEKRFGVKHERRVEVTPDETWVVTDTLHVASRHPHTARLHWLLPAWEVTACALTKESREFQMKLRSPLLQVSLMIVCNPAQWPDVTLVRAGQLLWGKTGHTADEMLRGWFSSTYGLKSPALSLAVEVESEEPIRFVTCISFSSVQG